jgi:acyl-CoA synthetase (AMP-forming)/AMP-acid ligase II
VRCAEHFQSGYAAVVHPDGYGVDIRDRLRDVIISGGENISSVEVEGVLLRHPVVQEAAVVRLPDSKWGEAPHAFIVLKPGATATGEELRGLTREKPACRRSSRCVPGLSLLNTRYVLWALRLRARH